MNKFQLHMIVCQTPHKIRFVTLFSHFSSFICLLPQAFSALSEFLYFYLPMTIIEFLFFPGFVPNLCNISHFAMIPLFHIYSCVCVYVCLCVLRLHHTPKWNGLMLTTVLRKWAQIAYSNSRVNFVSEHRDVLVGV
jgi:hypothetical protein